MVEGFGGGGVELRGDGQNVLALFFGSAFVGDIKLHYKARHRGPCVAASRYQFIRTLLLEGSGLWFSLPTVRRLILGDAKLYESESGSD